MIFLFSNFFVRFSIQIFIVKSYVLYNIFYGNALPYFSHCRDKRKNVVHHMIYGNALPNINISL